MLVPELTFGQTYTETVKKKGSMFQRWQPQEREWRVWEQMVCREVYCAVAGMRGGPGYFLLWELGEDLSCLR